MITRKQMRRVWRQEVSTRKCREAGTHPTDTGERSTAVLGGETVVMARCVCGERYPAPAVAT